MKKVFTISFEKDIFVAISDLAHDRRMSRSALLESLCRRELEIEEETQEMIKEAFNS